MPKTAILVDGAFFLKRYRHVYRKEHSPEATAKNLFTICLRHLDDKMDLHRILFYDCPPLAKKAHNPISGQAVDFSKTPAYTFRTALHRELVKKRKVALRLGRLADRTGAWVIQPRRSKELLSGKIQVADLQPGDVRYDVGQKGVDMRIGLDIASLAFKGHVERIVLFAGDADFVPAAKFARREGIDFILDPMWQQISPDLFEHIDGLKSTCRKPANA